MIFFFFSLDSVSFRQHPAHSAVRTVSTPPQAAALLRALAQDDVSSVSKLLSTPVSYPPATLVSASGRAARGWNWLHVAAAHGAPATLQWLISSGALGVGAVHQRAGDGRTPLLIAAEHSHAEGSDCEALAALLRCGAAADVARKPDGATAAHLCSARGCSRCLRLCLQRAPHLVDARCRTRGEQPLHVAARCGASECAAVLCALGARLAEPTGPRAALPLHLACLASRASSSSAAARTVRQLLGECRTSVAASEPSMHPSRNLPIGSCSSVAPA